MGAKIGFEMIKEKISARVTDSGIKIFAILCYHTSRSREYDFVMNNIPSKGNRVLDVRVLDVGSTGSLLPLKLAKKGYDVYVIDVRGYHEKHPNLTVVNTDIRKPPFSDDFFDVITCVSTIEHIGLGAYGDPKYDGGGANPRWKNLKEF